jgi:hypothetical protein
MLHWLEHKHTPIIVYNDGTRIDIRRIPLKDKILKRYEVWYLDNLLFSSFEIDDIHDWLREAGIDKSGT